MLKYDLELNELNESSKKFARNFNIMALKKLSLTYEQLDSL